MKTYKSMEEWQNAAYDKFGRMPLWAFSCPKCGTARTIADAKQQGVSAHEAYLICPACGYTAREDGMCDRVQRMLGAAMHVFPMAPLTARKIQKKAGVRK